MEMVQQYIEASRALISKQAEEIDDLKEKIRQNESDGLAKKAAEDLLDNLVECLESGHKYTPDSIAKAVTSRNIECLEKVSEEEVADDNSWGSLEENSIDNSLGNLRPSERVFYQRFGGLK